MLALGPRAQAAGTSLRAYDTVGSTNAEALTAARAGECGPAWFVTTEQTAGRGRRSRTWIAPRGNLASTHLDIIDVAPPLAATLGFAAGLALAAALRATCGSARDFHLKWPNDVLADGAKLAGILLEAETVPGGLAVVTGIGTNIVAAPEGTPTPAMSLRMLGCDIDAAALFAALSDAWLDYRALWDDGRGFAQIRKLWLDRAHGVGGPVTVRTGGADISGIFATLDESGCMIVDTGTRTVPIAAGDVYFGDARSMKAVS